MVVVEYLPILLDAGPVCFVFDEIAVRKQSEKAQSLPLLFFIAGLHFMSRKSAAHELIMQRMFVRELLR